MCLESCPRWRQALNSRSHCTRTGTAACDTTTGLSHWPKFSSEGGAHQSFKTMHLRATPRSAQTHHSARLSDKEWPSESSQSLHHSSPCSSFLPLLSPRLALRTAPCHPFHGYVHGGSDADSTFFDPHRSDGIVSRPSTLLAKAHVQSQHT